MPSIQESPYPLAFKVGNATELGLTFAGAEGAVEIRTRARSLQGMQKEAIVAYGPSGTVWRMVCDEGAGLNGTDLAPFPLAFFNAGLLDSYASEMLALARGRGLAIDGLALGLTNRYLREGSATQGTMTGKALPAELEVTIPAGGGEAQWMEIVRQAIAASPADALMRTALENGFTVTKNDVPLAPGRVRPLETPVVGAEDALFDGAAPASDSVDGVIVKLAEPDKEAAKAGAGSAMADSQRRELGILGHLTLRADGLRESQVRIARAGMSSTFGFLSENAAPFGGQERAPDGLAYVSAGIAFCFLTQVGRHAKTVKYKLAHYALAQDTTFSLPGVSGGTGREANVQPVKSHAHLTIDEGDDEARTLVDMGEQSCFLHGACAASLKTKVRVTRRE